MSVRTLVKSIQDIMRQDTGVDGDAQRISQLCWMFFLKIIDDQDQELELLKRRLPLAHPRPPAMARLGRRPRGHHRRPADLHQRRALPDPEAPANHRPRARTVRDVFEDAYNYMKSGQLMRQVSTRSTASTSTT
jgi:type I restriction enzyme M protein